MQVGKTGLYHLFGAALLMNSSGTKEMACAVD